MESTKNILNYKIPSEATNNLKLFLGEFNLFIRNITTFDKKIDSYIESILVGSGLQFDNQYNRLCI